jgi:hypothetical protein
MDLNGDLMRLSAQVAEKHKRASELDALERLLGSLREKEARFASMLAAEEKDVERLEGRSLSRWWLTVTGKLDGRLDAEKRETLEAGIRMDAVRRRIKELEADRERTAAKILELGDCESSFAALLARKESAILASDPEGASRILQMDEAERKLAAMAREIEEALRAGCAAKDQVDVVRRCLDSAEGWGTWDLIGGGLVTDAIKYSRLEDAQSEIERLQSVLDCFHTELADVQILREIQIDIGGFLQFADFFFDGLFADWTALSRIQDAQDQLSATERGISDVLGRLERMRGETERQAAALEAERAAFVENR